jgi:hypothetical protein
LDDTTLKDLLLLNIIINISISNNNTEIDSGLDLTLRSITECDGEMMNFSILPLGNTICDGSDVYQQQGQAIQSTSSNATQSSCMSVGNTHHDQTTHTHTSTSIAISVARVANDMRFIVE